MLSPRILIVGFSVTAETKGYAHVAKTLLGAEFPAASLDVRAIGGAAVNVVPYLREMLRFEDYDFVLLEIATCLRFAPDAATYGSFIQEIISAVVYAGATPLFLNLFRQGVDYASDQLSCAIEMAAAQAGVLIDSVGPEIAMMAEDEKAKYLRDGIHTTEAGSQLYGQRAFDLMKCAVYRGKADDAQRIARFLPPPSRKGTRLIAGYVPSKLCVREFGRSGINLPVVVIPEAMRATIHFSCPVKVCGFLVVTGPWNAWMSIEVPESGFKTSRHVYDDRCYYDHFKYVLFPDQVGVSVAVEVLSTPPKVALIKGEEWTGPRRIEIAGVFVDGDAAIRKIDVCQV